jgi:hypothetical protein
MVIVAPLPSAPRRGTVPEELSGSLRWAKGASDDR